MSTSLHSISHHCSHSLAVAFVLGFAVLPGFGQTLPGSGALPVRSAVAVALANSARLQAARSAISVAELQIDEAYGGVFPQATVEATYRRSADGLEQVLNCNAQGSDCDETEVVESQQSIDNAWSAGLRLNQTVLDMRVFSGLQAAERLRELRGEELRGAAQQLVDLVRRRYFAVLLAQERERLTEQSIARLQQTVDEARAREREGLAAEDELLLLEVQLANLEAGLLQARNQIAAARGSLLVAMGDDPAREVTLQGTLSELRLAAGAVNSPANADLLAASGAARLAAAEAEQLWRTAMTDRSDLRQLRTLERISGLQLTVQEAEYLPTIRAFGAVDFSSADEDDDAQYGTRRGGGSEVQREEGGGHDHRPRPIEYSQWQLSASAGITVQWQIFDGFARDARVAQRREAVRQAEVTLRQAELEMRYQVSTLVGNLQEARLRAASQLRSIEQAQRSYDIAAARYRAGLGSRLDVTAAESTLLGSQVNYAQAAHDYLAAASQLEAAVGQVPLADLAPARAAE